MDWFKRSVNLAYFPTHDGPLKNHWLVLRSIGEKIGLSSSAKEKLEWMIFYHTVATGNATTTARYFNISRKTLHKWLKRFDDKNLKTLEGLSRSPHTKRTWTVTFEEQERINYTIQDEWLQTSEVGLDNLDEANLDLTSWLLKYNDIRPHESLDYQTPLEYAVANFKVSPMWSARTSY